jgi:molybdate transport system substrate-binding protein
MRTRLAFLLLALWVSVSGLVGAGTDVVLRVRGDIPKPLDLTIANLEAMPRYTATARDHEGVEAVYEGVPLHAILQKAGVSMRENLRGPALRTGFLVKARDGYAALFSVAEIDPYMTDRVAFLADLKGDEPLPSGQGPLRVIIPGEKRHARWVRDVNEIEVVRIAPTSSGDWQQTGLLPAAEGSVLVAAAADLVFALEELNAAFTNRNPRAIIKVTTGASGSFYAQIQQGAPHEVFLSADLSFPEKLAAAGKADASTLFPYAQGHLVLWTTRTNLDLSEGLNVLLKSDVGRIAIANPETAPYGRAAKAALIKAGLWDQVQSKIVVGENISQTAQFVERGAVDAGIVALSLVSAPRLAKVGKWKPIPEDLYPPLIQGAVLTSRGSTNGTARAYLEFLKTDDAEAVFKRFGLGASTAGLHPRE